MASVYAVGKENRLYVRFRYAGRQRNEPTPYFCTSGQKGCKCRGCKSAAALGGEVERKKRDGLLDLNDFFPKSRAVQSERHVQVSNDVLFSSYAWQWLDMRSKVRAYSTARGYRTHIKSVTEKIGPILLKDVKPTHVRKIVADMVDKGLSPKTIKNALGILYTIFKDAVEDDIIDKNPAAGIKGPKGKRPRPDPFTMAEVETILQDMEKNDPDMSFLFAVGFYTGMRTGEIMALKWADIDTKAHKISITKTRTANRLKNSPKTGDRIIDIVPVLDAHINRHKRRTFLKSEWVFLTKDGKPVKTYNTLCAHFKASLERCGIRYRQPYQMRHTFACAMLSAGEPPRWIADTLGHATLEMLFKVYGNWLPPVEGRAAQKFEKCYQSVTK